MYLAILRIYAWEVDLGRERYLGRQVGVVWAAVDGHAVDAVLVDTLLLQSADHPTLSVLRVVHVVGREWCHSSPTSKGRPHCQVRMSTPLLNLSLHHAPVASLLYRTSTETLLSLLQLLKQTEVSRDLGAHCCS